MTVTAASFRTHYPEFVDSAVYTDSQIGYYLTIAVLLLNANRWKSLLDVGCELFIAHNLALEAIAQKTSAAGGVPGAMSGVVASKSVDKVSVSYDTSASIMPNAGHWNLTIYGARYIKLMRMFGAGPLQVGGGESPAYSGMAWPGPMA